MNELQFNYCCKGEYNELQEKYVKLLGGSARTVFSVFHNSAEEKDPNVKGSWIVEYPNIESKQPLLKGEWDLIMHHDKEIRIKVTDPTWYNILEFFEAFHDYHVFFEGLWFDESTRMLEVMHGS